jgi:hypothetical protein
MSTIQHLRELHAIIHTYAFAQHTCTHERAVALKNRAYIHTYIHTSYAWTQIDLLKESVEICKSEREKAQMVASQAMQLASNVSGYIIASFWLLYFL